MIVPFILVAHVRARRTGRNTRSVRLLTVAATVFCLTFFGPPSVMAESLKQTPSGSALIQGGKADLHFSRSDVGVKATSEGIGYHDPSNPGSRFGYWFDEASWLGFASMDDLFPPNPEDLAISIGADTGIFPLAGLVMFRYPTGQFQPYLGLGPTLFLDDTGLGGVDILSHIVMGLSYSF
jgi:hypothetical protein